MSLFFLEGFKKSIIFNQTIDESEECEDDVFGEEDDMDAEELEDAFDSFLDRLETLVKQ